MCRGDCLRIDCAAEKKENGAGCQGEAAGRGGRRMKGRAAAMTAPPAIVDGNLVAGEVTVLDTLLPESQEPTANHSSERISPSQPEEMPPRVPPSAVVCGDIPPPKAAAPTLHTPWKVLDPIVGILKEQLSGKENIIKSLKKQLEDQEKIIKSMGPLEPIVTAKNKELSYKQDVIQCLKDQLEDKEKIIKSMGQMIKDREKQEQKNQALKIKSDSIRAINEEFDQQQAQGKVWEQEVTVDDMVIGVVVRKKPRITPP